MVHVKTDQERSEEGADLSKVSLFSERSAARFSAIVPFAIEEARKRGIQKIHLSPVIGIGPWRNGRIADLDVLWMRDPNEEAGREQGYSKLYLRLKEEGYRPYIDAVRELGGDVVRFFLTIDVDPLPLRSHSFPQISTRMLLSPGSGASPISYRLINGAPPIPFNPEHPVRRPRGE